MTYLIRNWSELFETAETRKLDNLKWCPAPNKLDGLSYRLMVQERDRSDLFAAWNVMRAIASKTTPKERRGRIERDGRPLTAAHLAAMSGFPANIFERAFAFFSSPEIQWLLAEDDRPASATAADPESNPGASPARPADVPASPASVPAVWNGREGKEEKGNSPAPLALVIEPPPQLVPRAEDIYAAYPLKKERPQALKAIAAACKRHGAGFILERTMAYAKARGGNMEFVPYPQKWFNREGYNDDPATWVPKVNGASAQATGRTAWKEI